MTKQIDKLHDDISDLRVGVAGIPGIIRKEVLDHIKDTYVSKDAFKPVKAAVYTVTGTVAIAIISLIINSLIN